MGHQHNPKRNFDATYAFAKRADVGLAQTPSFRGFQAGATKWKIADRLPRAPRPLPRCKKCRQSCISNGQFFDLNAQPLAGTFRLVPSE